MLHGRARELRTLDRCLRAGRSAQIVGPGGVGKSALVSHLTWKGPRHTISFEDDAKDWRAALALALDVPLPERGGGERIAAALAARKGELFVLEGVDAVALPLTAMLRKAHAGGGRFVLTSREPLAVPGLEVIALEPLGRVACRALLRAAIGASPAVDDETLDAIAERCAGLPLGLEIAASWFELLEPKAVLAELGVDLPRRATRGTRVRPTSLLQVIMRSLALLEAPLASDLRALAVLPAGVDRRFAPALLGRSSRDTLRTIDASCRKSLLAVDASKQRLLLLRPVREVLVETSTPEQARRAAEALVAHAEELATSLGTRREPTALEGLAAERVNLVHVLATRSEPALRARAAVLLYRLHTALGPSEGPPDADAVASDGPALALARGDFLRTRGDFGVAKKELESALAWGEEAGDAAAEGEALRLLAYCARAAGRTVEAKAYVDRSRACARSRRDLRGEALCETEDAFLLQRRGLFEDAIARHLRARVMLTEAGSPREEAIALSYLAVATHRAGRVAESLPLHEEALRMHLALGHRRYEGAERMHLGFVHHELGHVEASRAAYESAIAIERALGDRALEGLASLFLARLLGDAGELGVAEQKLAEGRVRLRHADGDAHRATASLFEGHLRMARRAYREASRSYDEALRLAATGSVGFEVLTGAYLALALHAAGERGAKVRRALRASERAVAKVEHPFFAHALSRVSALVRESAPPPLPPGIVASSSEVRRLVRWTPQDTASGCLRLGPEARWVVTPEGRRVEFARKRAPRLLLLALANAHERTPGRALTLDQLVAAGWPGERLRPSAAEHRAYTAIWTLRKELLGEALLTRDDGYLLRPDLEVLREL